MDWLEAIKKLIPTEAAYRDLVQPAAKEVGSALGYSAKAARWLVAPIELLGAYHDRYEQYLIRVGKKVPLENFTQGHPQVCGPALDGLKYTDPNSLLTELFLNLLAAAIDKDRQHNAHPAFAEIIKQLSPDEARVLFELKKGPLVIGMHQQRAEDQPRDVVQDIKYIDIPRDELLYPQNAYMYVTHLIFLNLVDINFGHVPKEEEVREIEGEKVRMQRIRLSPMGKLFAEACVPTSFSFGRAGV